MKLNVAFLHHVFPCGGAERVTIDIARYLAEQHYNVYVFAVKKSEELYSEDIDKYISFKTIPKFFPNKAIVIEELIKSLNIHVLVEVVDELRGIEEIKQRTGVKVVLANHGEPFWQRHGIIERRQNCFFKKVLWKLFWHRVYPDDKGGRARRLAIKRSRIHYDHCDAYTVLCEAYKEQTCEAFGIAPSESHIVAIGNSEGVRDIVNYTKDNIIMFCGRLCKVSKRIDRLLRVWAMVQHRLPEWKLLIVGEGPYRTKLENLSQELKLERVSFEGGHSNVQPYYDRVSILALTSQTEGWGLCLTEAQASGVIPIAFACSAGVEEILKPDGVNGFLVNCFDEQEYAEKLVEIAQMSEEKKLEMRHAIVAHRAKYSPDVIARKWQALFDSLVDNPS